MRNQIIILTILSFFFTGWNCGPHDDPITPSYRANGFYGTVKDESGRPLSDVNVYYTFTWRSLLKETNAAGTISITFTLTDTSDVYLSFTKLGSSETVGVLVSERRPPGVYTVGYDGPTLPNGVYCFYLYINGTTTRFDVPHQTSDYAVLFTTEPLTRTASDGTFFLSYDRLGVTRAYGNTSVADYIDIILYKPGYKVLKTGFNVSGGPTIDRQFTLSP